MWRRSQTVSEAVDLIFMYKIHWKQLSMASYKVSLSVQGSSGARWVIPLFMQLQGVSGPLGINMSHSETQTDGSVLLLRRMGWGWKRLLYLSNSDVPIHFYSATAFTSAKVTFGFVWLSKIRFCDCATSERFVEQSPTSLELFGFLETCCSEKEEVGSKVCVLDSTRNLNIFSSKPRESRSLKPIKRIIHLNHISRSHWWLCHNLVYF